ncbi:MAG: nucleotidyltransferase [Acutalibacteraceae bacterium]
MKVAGIVAEYNPFHNGHKFQIDYLKNNGFTHVISAMSGNYVQRGEPAIADKWVRTSIALKNGVDLVLEIPTCYCLAPAEKYGSFAVEILNNTGIVNSLCFGSESGSIDRLLKLANEILDDEEVNERIKENLKKGITYAAAREQAVKELYGEEFSSLLKSPNDILGSEYLRALKKLNSDIKPLTIKREGVDHHDDETAGKFAAATKIRELIKSGEDYLPFIPRDTFDILAMAEKEWIFPVSVKNGERAILAKLRALSESDFERLADVSEGFHNRLFSAANKAKSFEEFYSEAKTKRYTLARIRRLAINAALGIYSYEKPPYIRVLGFSENGREILKLMKEKAKLPIVTSYADAKKISPAAEDYFEKESKYTDFYSMLMPEIMPKGSEFGKGVVKI